MTSQKTETLDNPPSKRSKGYMCRVSLSPATNFKNRGGWVEEGVCKKGRDCETNPDLIVSVWRRRVTLPIPVSLG